MLLICYVYYFCSFWLLLLFWNYGLVLLGLLGWIWVLFIEKCGQWGLGPWADRPRPMGPHGPPRADGLWALGPGRWAMGPRARAQSDDHTVASVFWPIFRRLLDRPPAPPISEIQLKPIVLLNNFGIHPEPSEPIWGLKGGPKIVPKIDLVAPGCLQITYFFVLALRMPLEPPLRPSITETAMKTNCFSIIFEGHVGNPSPFRAQNVPQKYRLFFVSKPFFITIISPFWLLQFHRNTINTNAFSMILMPSKSQFFMILG